MRIYTLRQIKDGTGFRPQARFLEITSEVETAINYAAACIREGIHDDHRFRLTTLADIEKLADAVNKR